MKKAIVFKNVRKNYKQLKAVDGISLSIEQGEFFGLLGPNGAGKSTLINMMAGLVKPTGGSISVMGFDVNKEYQEARHSVGIVPQELVFDPFFNVREMLRFQAGYFGKDKSNDKWVDEVIERLDLTDKSSTNMRALSGGMKRRALIAQALVHRPPVIVLDEPTAGVDVEIRKSMWDYLTQLNKEGMTIILTTHYLEEAESLCRNIAILNDGDLVEQTNMKKLLLKAKRQVLILDTIEKLTNNISITNCDCVVIDDTTLQVAQGENTSISDVIVSLSAQNINVSHLRSSQNRLEALFLSITS